MDSKSKTKKKIFTNLDAKPECPVKSRSAIPKKQIALITNKANSDFFILVDYTI